MVSGLGLRSQPNLDTYSLTAIWKILSELSQTFIPTSWGRGGKTAFWDRLWTLTENIFATEHEINNRKKLVNLQGLPYTPPKLMNSGPQTAENGWRVFAHPLHFRIRRTKCRAGSRWALPRFLLVIVCNVLRRFRQTLCYRIIVLLDNAYDTAAVTVAD